MRSSRVAGGRPRVTLLDVAKRAGVSKSTVSRVINDDPYVGLVAHRVVTEAMNELGYQRNEVARSLRLQATGTIGLIVGSLRNEFFGRVAHGVDQVLSDTGRTLLVGGSNGELERERQVLHEFVRRGVDGLIIALADDRSPEARKELRRAAVPTVLLDRNATGVRADSVLSDHRSGMEEALADLRAHGHRRIGLLAPPTSIRPGREILGAFGERGPVRHGRTEEFGHAATLEVLDAPDAPSALIVCGTRVLEGTLSALEARGLRAPNDLSLVAYDESAAARFHHPAISTLARDTEQLGELAARLIVDRIDTGREQPKKAFVPTRYVRRGTVTSPAA